MSSENLVVGLGATEMSIARYLQRSGVDAVFYDSRDKPPGIDELNELCPDANVLLGEAKLPKSIEKVIASPGVSDSQPMLKKRLRTRSRSFLISNYLRRRQRRRLSRSQGRTEKVR